MSQSSGRVAKTLLLFLFQPFIGFLASLKNLDSKVGRFVFVLFSTLWGYAQSFTYTPADGYRIGAYFCWYPISHFSTIIESVTEGRSVDIYLSVTNFIVHLFSDNAKVYFALLGLIYGILCYNVISSLLRERINNRSKALTHILFLLFTTASFSNLSMPRFWTATWLAALVFLKVTQGDKRWGWLALLLPLIHFSFAPISAILIIVTLFNRFFSLRPNVLFGAVCVMFLLSFALPKTVISQLIPETLTEENAQMASKMGYVIDSQEIAIEKEVSAYREANGFLTKSFQLLMKIGSFLLICYFHFRRNSIKNDSKTWITFSSIMLVAIVAYFMSIIPSTGWRYISVLWLMIYILLYRYFDVFHPAQFNKVLLLLYAINIYTISFMFYVAYRTVDLLLFYAPLPFVIIHGIGFPPVYFV